MWKLSAIWIVYKPRIQHAANRLWAMITKEFVQMRRDRATLAMMMGIPLIQLILFGFAINLNPRYLPTAVVGNDNSNISRRILVGMDNSSYFRFTYPNASESQAEHLLKIGAVQFVVNFPSQFTHDVIRGLHPSLLLQADATDPAERTLPPL